MTEQVAADDIGTVHSALLDRDLVVDPAELVDRRVGPTTAAALREYQRAHGLEPTGRLDGATRDTARHDREQPGRLRVVGRVTHAPGGPAPGLTVRAADRDLRREQPLGEAATDDAGYYLIVYPADAFARAEKSSADLLVRVLDGDRTVHDPRIAAIVFNAPPLAVVNVELAGAGEPGADIEYDRIFATVVPLLDDVGLDGLREDDEVTDVTFLAAETGIEPYRLAHFGVAQKLASAHQVPAAYFYALFATDVLVRAGGAAGLRFGVDLGTPVEPLFHDVVLLPEEPVRAAVTRAVDGHIVGRSVLDRLDGILADLAPARPAAQEYLRRERPAAVLAMVRGFLAAGTHERVAEILRRDAFGDIPGLLGELREAGAVHGPADENAVHASLALAAVLGFDAALVDRVRERQRIERPEEVRRLAQLSVGELGDIVREVGGDGPMVELHASALADRLESRYPTAAFTGHLARDETAFAGHREAILALLDANPDLDLANTNLTVLLRERPDAAMPAGGEAARSLLAAQRAFKLVPRYAQTKALLDAGLHSASSIYAMGRSRFVATAAKTGAFTVEQSEAAFARAADAHLAAGMLAGQLQATPAALKVRALGDGLPPGTLAKAAADFPNLRTLFGTGDVCACEECQSVHSASAYLVDTLQFLKNRLVVDPPVSPLDQKIAKDVLFARRPDLGDTDLSCANTNTSLPYIDAVCELLEEAVAPDPGFAYAGAIGTATAKTGEQIGPAVSAFLVALQAAGLPFTDQAVVFPRDAAGNQVVRDTKAVAKLLPDGAGGWLVRLLRQSYGSAEELAAAPAYMNQAAYTLLAGSTFAFGLPFDLAHSEADGYFAQLDIGRAELMRALQVGGSPTDAQVAAEALGLSDGQRQLIVTPAPAGQAAIWNTPATPAAATMRNVERFVSRSELEYPELVELLALRWINPTGALRLRHLNASCALDQQEIDKLDDDALDRLHRFIRLRRATGWASPTLDRVIRAGKLGNRILDDACLAAVALLGEVATRLGVDTQSACDLYDQLADARYAQVFANPAAVGPVPEVFVPANLAANEVAEALTPGSGVTLAAHRAYLALTLGVSAADLDVLLGEVAAPAIVSAANLSRLYALHRLSTALELPPAELLILRDLTGVDPLTGPAGTLTFLDHLTAVRAAGTSPTELRYTLTHVADDVAAQELPEATITALLETLRAGYRTAFAADAWAPAGDATLDELRNLLRASLARLPGRSASQLSALTSIVDGTWRDPDPAVTADQVIDTVLKDFVDTVPVKAAVVPAPTDAQRDALIRLIGAALASYFYAHDTTALATATVAAAFDLSEPMAAAALDGRLRQPAAAGAPVLRDLLTDDAIRVAGTITPAGLKAQYLAIRLLHAMSELARGLGARPEQLGWLLANGAALHWLAPDDLPYATGLTAVTFDRWARLQAAAALARELPPVANPTDPKHPWTLYGLFDVVLAPGGTAADVTGYLARLGGWQPDVLAALDTHLGLSTPDLTAYHDPAAASRLGAAATLLRRLGLTVPDAVALIKPTLTAADATTMRRALKARYADADWYGVLRNIQDRLRTAKRDALVAYLLAVNPTMTSPNDLYEHFLIDVEMSSCAPTSRIVQAHATVQLFVQRCLMGIEPHCIADVRADSGWAQWKWMANFRVWEANVKVFLWPENYMIPQLRDDKSELFVALENSLRQDALTDIAIEDATVGYLEGLDDIAHLDVMAAYYQTNIHTMHVFARTKGGDPPIYYYRRFEKERAWTPWERVPLDITGNHLLAFERNSRLTLAWPVFTIEPETEKQLDITDPLPPKTPVPEKRMKIQLAVSERANGKWRPKKVSRDPLPLPFDGSSYTHNLPAPDDFNFFVADLGSAGQSVACVHISGYYIGGFALTGCKGYPEPTPYASSTTFLISPAFENAELRTERFAETTSGSELATRTAFTGGWQVLLGTTPSPDRFTVTHPMQLTRNDFLLMLLQTLLGGGGGVAGPDHADRAFATRVRQPVSLGTFMPYFYGDYDRAYVIIPGFYGYLSRRIAMVTDVANARTYSDIDQFLTDITALIVKYVAIYQQDPAHDVNALLAKLAADSEYQRLLAEFEGYRRRRYAVQFANFYHPLACFLRTTLNRFGIPGLMRREVQLNNTGFDFNAVYSPTGVVVTPYPVEDFDFTLGGAYSSYNWEIFVHLPHTIASMLNRDQRFDEAREWLHYIFNPVGVIDPPDPANPAAAPPGAPQKYWITKPFFQRRPADYLAQQIDTITNTVALDPAGTGLGDLRFAIEQWRDKPFAPYVIGRSRPVAFQLRTVTMYVQNLIDWGDSLFQQYTREAITQATQLYIMADQLLGPKPRQVPPAVTPPVQTYNQLEKDVDLLANALVDLENLIPDLTPAGGAGSGAGGEGAGGEVAPVPISTTCLYFCVPPNEDLLRMWDVIADRLFKIRHCQNIDGVETPLPLFSPPIDPGALVRAVAGGMDIASFVAGLGAPPPNYRFRVLSQRATELVQQVSALGNALLRALEQRDAEKLGQIRATQEIALLSAVRGVKVAAIAEATGGITALRRSRDVIEARRQHYASREFMNNWETAAAALYGVSLVGESAVTAAQILSGMLAGIPDFLIGVAGLGGSPAANAGTGGTKASKATDMGSRAAAGLLRAAEKSAALAATQGLYHRRREDWDLQVTLAGKELAQIDQQITNAQLHVAMLNADLVAHDKQAANVQATREYLEGKFTDDELYDWTIGQISAVYFSAYKLALDAARKAERAFEHELGTDANFISGNYWDSLRKGLSSADALHLAIKQMEMAYLDQNKREYELTKHVSLAQLDPAALVQLRATGLCYLEVPETLFDLDYPGHYRRRLKAVGLSLPCVVGPYTTVNATLSLVSNRYRKNTALRSTGSNKDRYREQAGGDDRFVYNVGAIQSIATSTGVSDSGVFELTFADDRYLPFEGCGAISRWLLELPGPFRQFDYDSISDVVLHLRYTARDGGPTLRTVVTGALKDLANELVQAVGGTGLFQAYSLAQQFPDEWWQLCQTRATRLTVGLDHLPFLVRDHQPQIESLTWYATVAGAPASYPLTVDGTVVPLNSDPNTGLCTATTGAKTLGTPIQLGIPATPEPDDLVLLVRYRLQK